MELEAVRRTIGGRLIRPGTFQTLGTLNARTPEMLSFAEDVKYLAEVRDNPDLACLLCTDPVAEALAGDPTVPASLGLLVVPEPRAAFFRFHNWLVEHTEFYRQKAPNQVHPTARIHPSAVLEDHNVIVGRNVVIDAHAVIHANTTLEDGVVIRAHATVGGSGFEFKRVGDRIISVAHGGGVILRREVEVLANTHIARGLFGTDTEVGEQTRIDALVNVSHNVRIGRRCLIAANSAISGSTVIGDDVWIGVGAVLADGLTIGRGAHISIGAVVVNDVAEGARVTGNFAIPHRRFLLNHWNAQR